MQVCASFGVLDLELVNGFLIGGTSAGIYTSSGAGLMNTVINYASGKPSDPLHGYSYVHDSKIQQPHQIAATMHKMLSVTAVLV